jgi:hypothetical protein
VSLDLMAKSIAAMSIAAMSIEVAIIEWEEHVGRR